jgi:hypothetical protein
MLISKVLIRVESFVDLSNHCGLDVWKVVNRPEI